MSDIYFFKYLVNSQVFYRSKYTFALVNIKPLVPGHVLVVPLRTTILRFADLTAEESQDYMLTLQFIHKFIIHVYHADALNIAIQDGPESGQSIPHLHTHLIPRYGADGLGDSVHRNLEQLDLDQALLEFYQRKHNFGQSKPLEQVADMDRVARSEEEMAKEAQWLRRELNNYVKKSVDS